MRFVNLGIAAFQSSQGKTYWQNFGFNLNEAPFWVNICP